jgi:hypothetical protein
MEMQDELTGLGKILWGAKTLGEWTNGLVLGWIVKKDLYGNKPEYEYR